MNIYDEIVPLGFDCTIARFLKNYNLRKNSYPLDWVVSRDFDLIVDNITNNIIKDFLEIKKIDGFYKNILNIEFLHHSNITEEEFKTTFTNRYNKLYETLTNNKNVLFLRKSHDLNNCEKTNKNFSEIDSTIKLCEWMKTFNKKFTFVLFLSCPKCHKDVINHQVDNLIIIKKKDDSNKDSTGYYNLDIEEYIKKLKIF